MSGWYGPLTQRHLFVFLMLALLVLLVYFFFLVSGLFGLLPEIVVAGFTSGHVLISLQHADCPFPC